MTYSGPAAPQGPGPAPAPLPPRLPLCESNATPSPCVVPSDAYRHDGFYFRFGGGLEFLDLFGDGPYGSARVSGSSLGALLALGGNVADGLVVAGAIHTSQTRSTFNGSSKPVHDATAAGTQLGVLVDWYPKPTDGWHVGAMAGLGVVGIAEADIADASGLGFGGVLLGGYEWWIGQQWSLGLFAIVSATTPASLRTRSGDDVGYKFSSFSAGLGYGFTLH